MLHQEHLHSNRSVLLWRQKIPLNHWTFSWCCIYCTMLVFQPAIWSDVADMDCGILQRAAKGILIAVDTMMLIPRLRSTFGNCSSKKESQACVSVVHCIHFSAERHLILRPLLSKQPWFKMAHHPVTLLTLIPSMLGFKNVPKAPFSMPIWWRVQVPWLNLRPESAGEGCGTAKEGILGTLSTLIPGCREGLSLWYCCVDYESMMGKHHDLLKAWDDRTQRCHPKLWFIYVYKYIYI